MGLSDKFRRKESTFQPVKPNLCSCPGCGRDCPPTEMFNFNNVSYCRSCAGYLSRNFTVQNGTAIETATGAKLENIIILDWTSRPYTVRGSAPKEAEQFIITQLSNRAEIFWHYTNFDYPEPPWYQSVTGTEVLPADYFDTHTLGDFTHFISEQPWGMIFFFQLANSDRVRTLFSRK